MCAVQTLGHTDGVPARIFYCFNELIKSRLVIETWSFGLSPLLKRI